MDNECHIDNECYMATIAMRARGEKGCRVYGKVALKRVFPASGLTSAVLFSMPKTATIEYYITPEINLSTLNC